jgi:hypothetical protein
MKPILICAFLIVTAVTTVEAQTAPPPRPYKAYVDNNRYREFSELGRSTYVAGLADGISHALEGAAPSLLARWSDCTAQRPWGQLRAMLDRYLDEHPEGWHYGTARTFYKVVAVRAYGLPGR